MKFQAANLKLQGISKFQAPNPQGVGSGGFAGDDVYFDFNAVPQDGLNGGAGGKDGDAFEKLLVNDVVTVEFFDVGQMNGGFDDVTQGATGGFKNFFDMREGVERFLLDGAADGLGGLGVHGALAADVNPAVNFDGGGIGAGALFFVRMLNFSF